MAHISKIEIPHKSKRPIGCPAFLEGYRDHAIVPRRACHHASGTWAKQLWNAGWDAAESDQEGAKPC